MIANNCSKTCCIHIKNRVISLCTFGLTLKKWLLFKINHFFDLFFFTKVTINGSLYQTFGEVYHLEYRITPEYRNSVTIINVIQYNLQTTH